MPKRASPPPAERDEDPALAISPEKVCFVIIKAREFDVKEGVADPDSASNPSDDRMIDVLETHADDPVLEELTSFISALSEDEQIDLVALMWLGRDDNTADDWTALREEARRAHRPQRRHTANYLIGTPLAGDYLEEGLSLLGHCCEAFEIGRL
jgi:hypothetical protein